MNGSCLSLKKRKDSLKNFVIAGLTRYLSQQIVIVPLKGYYSVYILSNFARTVLYVGVTNDLETRVRQHRDNKAHSFTAKYKCHFLLYYEDHSDIRNTIGREKQLKKWLRKWKFEIIMKSNPGLKDLAEGW